MIDIDDLEASAAAVYDVVVMGKGTKSPTGFRVMGSSSPQYTEAKREIEIINIKAYAEKKTQPAIESDEGAQLAAQGAERLKMALIRRCVVDWFGFTKGGEAVPFSGESLERVLKAKPAWVDVLVREIEDDANFMKG